MRLHHIAWQQILFGIMFCHDTGQQIALGRDHFAVFIGVFVQQFGIGLLDQVPGSLYSGDPVSHALNRDRDGIQYRRASLMRAFHQQVFDQRLYFTDVDFIASG